ncbi:MAG: hypothetical protein M1833_005473 [Piccolia ochrophora]|nr:MAG: hypothetical protein M1833_005473 [Piccolia ochrophora]
MAEQIAHDVVIKARSASEASLSDDTATNPANAPKSQDVEGVPNSQHVTDDTATKAVNAPKSQDVEGVPKPAQDVKDHTATNPVNAPESQDIKGVLDSVQDVTDDAATNLVNAHKSHDVEGVPYSQHVTDDTVTKAVNALKSHDGERVPESAQHVTDDTATKAVNAPNAQDVDGVPEPAQAVTLTLDGSLDSQGPESTGVVTDGKATDVTTDSISSEQESMHRSLSVADEDLKQSIVTADASQPAKVEDASSMLEHPYDGAVSVEQMAIPGGITVTEPDTKESTVNNNVSVSAEPQDGADLPVVTENSTGADAETSVHESVVAPALDDPEPKGHTRSGSVKKPTSFKSVSVTKNFLAKAAGGSVSSKLAADKGSTSSSGQQGTLSQGASRPRLVAKSGSGPRDAAPRKMTLPSAGEQVKGPDPSQVWNKNRPAQPAPPKHFTDEELKQQYGIHLATRLQADEAGKEAKWADIDDDDDDWAPDTIEWNDGTKITLSQREEQPLQPKTQSPAVTQGFKPDGERPSSPGSSKANMVPVNGEMSKTGGVANASSKTGGLVLKGAPEKPTLVAKPPVPSPVKSPWATLPPIDKIPPVTIVPQQHSTSQLNGGESHVSESMPPPPSPAKEIAADDFNRSWRESHSLPNRELFNSQSGRYEPVNDQRRGSTRNDQTHRQPSVLQRPAQADPRASAEPSAAFQTSRSSIHEGQWGRGRTSSSVSGGSIGHVHRMSFGKGQEMPLSSNDVALSQREGAQQDLVLESPPTSLKSHPTSPSLRHQQHVVALGNSDRSAPQSELLQKVGSPTPVHVHPHASQDDGLQQTYATQQADIQLASNKDQQTPVTQDSADQFEDPVEIQKRIMRERRELARTRRVEEEAKEEAERKERIRLKMEALGMSAEKDPKSKPTHASPSKDAKTIPEPDSKTTKQGSHSPPKPPVLVSEGEVKQYGMMKVHHPDAVKKQLSRSQLAANKAENAPAGSHTLSSSNPATADQPLPQTSPNKTSIAFPEGKVATTDTSKPSAGAGINQHLPNRDGSNANSWGSTTVQSGLTGNLWGPPSSDKALGNGTFDHRLATGHHLITDNQRTTDNSRSADNLRVTNNNRPGDNRRTPDPRRIASVSEWQNFAATDQKRRQERMKAQEEAQKVAAAKTDAEKLAEKEKAVRDRSRDVYAPAHGPYAPKKTRPTNNVQENAQSKPALATDQFQPATAVISDAEEVAHSAWQNFAAMDQKRIQEQLEEKDKAQKAAAAKWDAEKQRERLLRQRSGDTYTPRHGLPTRNNISPTSNTPDMGSSKLTSATDLQQPATAVISDAEEVAHSAWQNFAAMDQKRIQEQLEEKDKAQKAAAAKWDAEKQRERLLRQRSGDIYTPRHGLPTPNSIRPTSDAPDKASPQLTSATDLQKPATAVVSNDAEKQKRGPSAWQNFTATDLKRREERLQAHEEAQKKAAAMSDAEKVALKEQLLRQRSGDTYTPKYGPNAPKMPPRKTVTVEDDMRQKLPVPNVDHVLPPGWEIDPNLPVWGEEEDEDAISKKLPVRSVDHVVQPGWELWHTWGPNPATQPAATKAELELPEKESTGTEPAIQPPATQPGWELSGKSTWGAEPVTPPAKQRNGTTAKQNSSASKLSDTTSHSIQVTLPSPKAMVKLPPSLERPATPTPPGQSGIEEAAGGSPSDWQTRFRGLFEGVAKRRHTPSISSASKAQLEVTRPQAATTVSLPHGVGLEAPSRPLAGLPEEAPVSTGDLFEEREFGSRPAVRFPSLVPWVRPVWGSFKGASAVDPRSVDPVDLAEPWWGVAIRLHLPGTNGRWVRQV